MNMEQLPPGEYTVNQQGIVTRGRYAGTKVYGISCAHDGDHETCPACRAAHANCDPFLCECPDGFGFWAASTHLKVFPISHYIVGSEGDPCHCIRCAV